MTNPDETDEALMLAWRRGLRSAGDRLHDRLSRPFSAIAHALCGRGALAEEAVQEAFLRLVRSVEGYREGGAVRPWAYQIARNAARDLMRRRRPEVSLDAVPEPATTETPIESLLVREDVETASARLAELPPIHREVLVLRYGLGLAGSALAETLGITKSALWTRLSRARAALRKRVRDEM
jgi:RNA polymerase sigma-70 factor (ECF subfamily)